MTGWNCWTQAPPSTAWRRPTTPDAIITESGPEDHAAGRGGAGRRASLIDQTAMLLPHIKITELLMEVDEWTGFTATSHT
jgi:hypothetical protein